MCSPLWLILWHAGKAFINLTSVHPNYEWVKMRPPLRIVVHAMAYIWVWFSPARWLHTVMLVNITLTCMSAGSYEQYEQFSSTQFSKVENRKCMPVNLIWLTHSNIYAAMGDFWLPVESSLVGRFHHVQVGTQTWKVVEQSCAGTHATTAAFQH